jgi:DNA adenine methylase
LVRITGEKLILSEKQSYLGDFFGTGRPLPIKPKPYPPLKWVGAKAPLLGWMSKFLRKGDYYYEPFIGGGSVYFYMYRHGLLPEPSKCQLSDLNPRLVNYYRVIRDHPHAFLDGMERYKDKNTKEFYQKVQKVKLDDNLQDACLFYYLNKTSWRGMYAEDKKGDLGIGFGYRPKVKFVDHNKILNASGSLQGVKIYNLKWEEALRGVSPGSFVYLDPPYYELYTEYTKHGFNIWQHKQLADWCNTNSKRGVYILQSNIDVPEVRELYKGWKFDSQEILYKVNFKTKTELIIYNYDL